MKETARKLFKHRRGEPTTMDVLARLDGIAMATSVLPSPHDRARHSG